MSLVQIIELITGILIFLYCLWMSGYICVRSGKAMKFIGSWPKKNSSKFRFIGASLKLKRVIILEEYRSYYFEDRGEIEKGGRVIEVADHKGNVVLHLDENTAEDSVHIFEGGRYYLTIILRKASGNVDLSWLEV